MNLSRYLKIWPQPGKPGASLVFSTRTGSTTVIPALALERLRRGDVPASAVEALTRLGVGVEDIGAERAAGLGYLDQVNRVDPGVTAAVILGMGCNFACPYCYEGTNGDPSMDETTGRALIAFLKTRFRLGKQTLTLDLYGGEPLLYRDRIRQLAASLKPWVEGQGGRFRFTLVTNGSLLTPEVVDELLPLGLVSAKVTVDGPADLHDRSRPYAGGRASFAAVLANLRAVCERVKVGLGGNYTAANWRRFPELLDDLQTTGLGPDRLAQVSFSPVLATDAAPEACAGCASVNDPWLAEAATALRGEILRRGYSAPKITPSPCMVDLTDALVANWDGSLTKCPALIGRKEFAVGDLWNGVTGDVEATFGGPRWKMEESCQDCSYLPLCFGGCRTIQYQRTSTMAGVECQKPFLDATLEPMIRQDVQHRWTTSVS
ncbi:MAG: geopeptide radical SAM maturase [Deferrisomatales bacterium]|nr:geopeptide radical SAM maturase [Deferrisomatales bacterium]